MFINVHDVISCQLTMSAWQLFDFMQVTYSSVFLLEHVLQPICGYDQFVRFCQHMGNVAYSVVKIFLLFS